MKRSFKKLTTLMGACAVLLVSNFVPAQAQTQTGLPEAPVNLLGVENPILLQAGITQALGMGGLEGTDFIDTPGMKAFYEARGYEPAWIQSAFLQQRKSEKLLETFKDSWKHGLNPAAYNVDEIERLKKVTNNTDKFKLDLVLSDALVKYGRDLTGMRVNPRSIGQKSKYWRQQLRGIDILDHVANASNVDEALKGLEPQGKLYEKLQSELVNLYKDSNIKEEKPVHIKGLLRPRTENKAVLYVRERMGFKADAAPQGTYYYDDELAKAVMAFQKSNGLKPDGIIGSQTLNIMNITREDRINQILVNLERLRWMEPLKPSRYVMVNVPSAMLWAVENNEVALEMPVVVGRKKRPTNIFTTTITGIRFNPTWTVPPTIKRDDYLPKLQKDPYYLSDRGIDLKEGGQTIDPGLIDWNAKTWGEVNAMRMVQGSGARNPLGLVRVIMNNPYNIYLHDTPTKSYFKRTDRALSSGCVRMAEPQKLADFVLAPNESWSEEKKQAVLKRGRQKEIWAQEPLPVYIVYQTVWLGESGQIVYGTDLYGHDRKLLNALNKIDGVVYPATAEDTKTALNVN